MRRLVRPVSTASYLARCCAHAVPRESVGARPAPPFAWSKASRRGAKRARRHDGPTAWFFVCRAFDAVRVHVVAHRENERRRHGRTYGTQARRGPPRPGCFYRPGMSASFAGAINGCAPLQRPIIARHTLLCPCGTNARDREATDCLAWCASASHRSRIRRHRGPSPVRDGPHNEARLLVLHAVCCKSAPRYSGRATRRT